MPWVKIEDGDLRLTGSPSPHEDLEFNFLHNGQGNMRRSLLFYWLVGLLASTSEKIVQSECVSMYRLPRPGLGIAQLMSQKCALPSVLLVIAATASYVPGWFNLCYRMHGENSNSTSTRSLANSVPRGVMDAITMVMHCLVIWLRWGHSDNSYRI